MKGQIEKRGDGAYRLRWYTGRVDGKHTYGSKTIIIAVSVLLAQGAALTACNSPADIRAHCLRTAHHVVREQSNEEAYKEMVREYYLRCLEARGTPDAPPKPPSETSSQPRQPRSR